MKLILAEFWLIDVSESGECNLKEMSLKEWDDVFFFFWVRVKI